MARYIDADALIERILKLTVVTDDMYGMGIARGIERAETTIEMTPTADVAPKSEVDRLEKALAAKDAEYDQALQDKARECNMAIDKIHLVHREQIKRLKELHEEELAKAKREVARKVIAEVDLLISKYRLEPNYSMGQMEIDLSEIEKKYTKGA